MAEDQLRSIDSGSRLYRRIAKSGASLEFVEFINADSNRVDPGDDPHVMNIADIEQNSLRDIEAHVRAHLKPNESVTFQVISTPSQFGRVEVSFHKPGDWLAFSIALHTPTDSVPDSESE